MFWILLIIPLCLGFNKDLFDSRDSYISQRKSNFGYEQHNIDLENHFIVKLDPNEIKSTAFVHLFHHRLLKETTSSTITPNNNRHIEIESLEHVYHGVTIKGLTRNEIEKLPYIKEIIPDTIRYIKYTTSEVPWNIDRLDQSILPYDNMYTSNYTGAGVDVYVVDTGE